MSHTIIGYRITPVTVVITFDDGPKVLSTDHPAFEEISTLLRSHGDPDQIYDLCSPKVKIAKYLDGMAQVTDDAVIMDGQPIEHAVVPLILNMIKDGEDPTVMLAFLKRLILNPSMNSRNQLWNFIERNGITLYGDSEAKTHGWLVLYKGVKEDYTDCHTGTINNKPGTWVPIMARSQVNDNPTEGCSVGYHAGAYNYVKTFGQRKLIVLVDPAAVVSVPHDANCAKLRCTQYYVLQEIEREKFKNISTAVYCGVYEVAWLDFDGQTTLTRVRASNMDEAEDLIYDNANCDEIIEVIKVS